VHPFREVNGRTQRVFWNRVARKAGWELDWRGVHGNENHHAARITSDEGNLSPLIEMFDKVVASPRTQPEENWSAQGLRRLSINPADHD
jgi:cell filamentation protein